MPGEQDADFGAIMEELEYRHSIRFATHGAEKAKKNKDMPGKSLIEGIERQKRVQPLQINLTGLKNLLWPALPEKPLPERHTKVYAWKSEVHMHHRRLSSVINPNRLNAGFLKANELHELLNSLANTMINWLMNPVTCLEKETESVIKQCQNDDL